MPIETHSFPARLGLGELVLCIDDNDGSVVSCNYASLAPFLKKRNAEFVSELISVLDHNVSTGDIE